MPVLNRALDDFCAPFVSARLQWTRFHVMPETGGHLRRTAFMRMLRDAMQVVKHFHVS